MPKTYSDQVYSGTLGTVEATLATIAANTTFILKGIIISNSNAADKYANIKIDDKRIVPNKVVPTKNSIIITFPDGGLPIAAGKTIKGTGEVAADMDYYIWGVNEVTS